jgi:hypothetical protein
MYSVVRNAQQKSKMPKRQGAIGLSPQSDGFVPKFTPSCGSFCRENWVENHWILEVFHFWTNPDKGWWLFPTNWSTMWCLDFAKRHMFKQNNPGSWIRMTFDVNLSFHAMRELHKCLPNHYVLSRIKEAQSAKWMICTSWFHDPLAIKEAEEVEEVKEAETFPRPSEVENPQDRCFPWLPVLSG